MIPKIKLALEHIEKIAKIKPIKIISHFDTDGITSAAIFSRMMQRLGIPFSLQIVKNLEPDFINTLPESHVLIFLDLASGSLDHLARKKTEIIIFDHHEIMQEIPSNVYMVNPLKEKAESISSAAICYLTAKTQSHHNLDLANLAIIGMVGDAMEKNLGKIYTEILKDAETLVKRGLLLSPATSPIDRMLEYSSNPFIPGVTGSYKGVIELLRDANIERMGERYKSLSELSDEEMSSLITAIMLRGVPQKSMEELIGNIYLVKFFNKLEDARELSALINSCSRMDNPSIALGFCLGNKSYREEADKGYIVYKQHLIAALKYVNEMEKIQGKKYTIINAKDNIKDTIIGTVASIISNSPVYEQGTIIIALAYNEDKIKVSARLAGKEGRNVREVLAKVVIPLGGEVGGHPNAAGCLIEKKQEEAFIQELKRELDIEL